MAVLLQSLDDLCVVQFLSSPIDLDLILPAVTICVLIAAVFLRVLAEDGIQKLTGDGLLYPQSFSLLVTVISGYFTSKSTRSLPSCFSFSRVMVSSVVVLVVTLLP